MSRAIVLLCERPVSLSSARRPVTLSLVDMETSEAVILDAPAQHRLFVLTQVLDGRLAVADAARLLGRSERQVRRLLAALRRDGAAGLVHGNRGRAPVHRTPEGLRARLVELATTTNARVNRAHLAELLAGREGIKIPERTLRRVLADAGVRPVRRRRLPRHRIRRERAAQAGRLLQVDGSRHRWLGPDGPYLTLLGAIDDATGIATAAVFRAQEDTAGYLELFARTIAGYGVPLEVYSDRHGIFVVEGRRAPTLEEQLRGEEPRTQVGRAFARGGDRLDLAPEPRPYALTYTSGVDQRGRRSLVSAQGLIDSFSAEPGASGAGERRERASSTGSAVVVRTPQSRPNPDHP